MSEVPTTPANANSDELPVQTGLETPPGGLVGMYDRLPARLKWSVVLGAIVVVAIVLGVWHTFYWHWFEIHSGTANESSPYYGFWSGFGSDIGEATIFVGVAAAWRHHNCHVKGCARLGRPVDGTPYLACPRHHPAHASFKRGVSLEEIRRAHRQAREERRRSSSN